MKDLSGSESWVSRFLKTFCIRDKSSIDGYALLLLKATIPKLQDFIRSEIAHAKQEAREEVLEMIKAERDKPCPPDRKYCGNEEYQHGYFDAGDDLLVHLTTKEV